MMDPVEASAAAFNIVLTIGFTVYGWRLVAYFGRRTQMGKAWLHMFIAGIILVAVAVLSFLDVFEGPPVPEWWRTVGEGAFSLYLLIAVIAIFRSWKNLGKNI